MHPYAPQKSLSDLTEDQSRLWVLVQGILVIEFAWLFGGSLWLSLWGELAAPETSSRLGGLLGLLAHGILWVAVAWIVRLLQQRDIRALIGPWTPMVLDFIATLKWAGGFALGFQLLALLPFLGDPEVQQPFLPWAITLPITLSVIFVQTTAEELYFRGFIQSTLAARFRNPVIWMGLPSVFFGLVHITGDMATRDVVHVFLFTSLFGLACADLTARSGNLGAALALHFSHNATIFLLYGVVGAPNSALTLFLFPETMDPAAGGADLPIFGIDLLFYLLTLLILWLAARNAIRR